MAQFQKRSNTETTAMNQQFRKHIRHRKNGIALTLTATQNFQKDYQRPVTIRPSMAFPNYINHSQLSFEEKMVNFRKNNDRVKEAKSRSHFGRYEEVKAEQNERRQQRESR